MNPRVRAVLGVSLMSTLLVLYFAFAGFKAVALLATGDPIAILMGVALLVFPVIGAWALVREIMFGFTSTKLVDALAESGDLPEELVDVEVSRAEVREVADAAFPKYREAAEGPGAGWQEFSGSGSSTTPLATENAPEVRFGKRFR